MDYVQKHNICTNVPSSQTFRSLWSISMKQIFLHLLTRAHHLSLLNVVNDRIFILSSTLRFGLQRGPFLRIFN
jgi:hypothetical protein